MTFRASSEEVLFCEQLDERRWLKKEPKFTNAYRFTCKQQKSTKKKEVFFVKFNLLDSQTIN